MSELLQGLTPFQWVLIVVGLLVMVPSVRNFFVNLGNKEEPSVNFSGNANNLTSIVHKWEVLNNACVDAGLVDAQDKLREVFLVLANKRSVDPKPSPVEKDDADGEN